MTGLLSYENLCNISMFSKMTDLPTLSSGTLSTWHEVVMQDVITGSCHQLLFYINTLYPKMAQHVPFMGRRMVEMLKKKKKKHSEGL